MKSALRIFKNNKGYAYLKELKKEGIHTDTIKRLLDDNLIEKVKPGLYKLVDMPVSAQQGMIDVCMAMPKAVICLHSALSYYELTTTVPGTVMTALPFGIKPVKLYYPPIQVFNFTEKNYTTGRDEIKLDFGVIRIYDIEKTIVDCFRFRNKLGEDAAREGLKNYLSQPHYNLNKLIRYAKNGRAYSIIKPYIEAWLAL